MQSEKALVRSLLITLFLVLGIVYTGVRQNRDPIVSDTQDETVNQETNNENKTVNINDNNTAEAVAKVETIVPSKSITKINNTNLTIEDNEKEEEKIDEELQTKTKDQVITLPGTSLYVGGLASLQKMSLTYEYILKDNQNIYYIYLGKQEQDFGAIARAYNGNIVEIVTDVELQKHGLFGDAITYINIPQYKNNLVLMVVYIKNDIRLVQIDFEKYHSSKSYIKERFNY